MIGPGGAAGLGSGLLSPAMPTMTDIPRATLPIATPDPLPTPVATTRPLSLQIPQPPVMLASTAAPATTVATAAPATPPAAATRTTPLPVVPGTPQPIPFRHVDSGFFALTSPPFIEGDFVAAARQPDGQWLAVARARSRSPTPGRSGSCCGSHCRWRSSARWHGCSPGASWFR
ncbi:hypothetical protein [Novosphingobium sp. ST904]|uniref:hypothetical protein n=1 Tax=Novosphingobium sp. ST904 TaxID=1684385 RepID=UPI001E3B5244|nr:hypothetical protein [Novosphingobium sp. ST904]